MPYLVRKQKCEQADGDAGTHVIYKKKRDGSQGEKVGCTTDPEQYKKALYAAEGGYIKEIIREEVMSILEEKKGSSHPSHYSAPEGSKRDKQLDATKADLASGDPKRVARAYRRRERMEKAERKKKGFKNVPRSDTKKESVRMPEATLREMIRKTLEEELSKATKASLKKKAEKRGLTPSSVYAEFRKGLAAWASSGSRKGMGQHQWAHARVNAATPSKPWAVVKKAKKKKKKNEILQRLREAIDSTHSAPYVKKADLSDNPYRPFSDKYYEYVRKQRQLFREGKLEFTNMDEEILRSDLGEFAMYEGEKVPLDMPMPIMEDELEEAEYKGREVELNSPTRSSGPKKYKVYVKNEKGNVVPVHFGDAKGGLKTNIDDPAARKSFVARHKCEEDKPKTSPGYWSCRIPRFSEKLGMKKMSYRFW